MRSVLLILPTLIVLKYCFASYGDDTQIIYEPLFNSSLKEQTLKLRSLLNLTKAKSIVSSHLTTSALNSSPS